MRFTKKNFRVWRRAAGMELRVAAAYIRCNIASAAELRISFAMQIVGMMVNNITFVLLWWLFFGAFGTINGWNIQETIALQGFVALAFGIVFSFFSGADELPSAIYTGAFDSVLLTPRNLYARIFTLTTRVSAIGDIFFGILLLGVYWFFSHPSAGQILALGTLILPAALIMMNFLLATACIGFFIHDATEIAKFSFESVLGPSLYPAGMFQGFMRFFFIFVLPALAIGGIPVEAVQGWSVVKIAVVWLVAALWTAIAVWVLRKGVRRYESGNLTGARL